MAGCSWLDYRIISTDDPAYAAEAEAHGLDAPFLRPAELGGDAVSGIDVMIHATREAEKVYDKRFDYILLAEPTSPLRKPQDLERLARILVETNADSAICVSEADSKYNPLKLLTIREGLLRYYDPAGRKIVARQQLGPVYIRNGIGYGVSRQCLLDKKQLITDSTVPVIIDRPVANIDNKLDLQWAEFLMARESETGWL